MLDLVKSKSSLRIKSQFNIAFEEIKAKLSDLGDVSDLEDCPSIVFHICELIENLSKPILEGKEKQKLALRLLIEAFPRLNNELDMKRLSKLIDFLVDMELVKKVPMSTMCLSSVRGFLKRSSSSSN